MRLLTHSVYTPTPTPHPPKSWATLDGKIVDPDTTVKFEMRNESKVHGAQT